MKTYKELSNGNKRIGIHLSLVFLKINVIDLNYAQEGLVDFGLKIASGKIKKEAIQEWFIEHKV